MVRRAAEKGFEKEKGTAPRAKKAAPMTALALQRAAQYRLTDLLARVGDDTRHAFALW